jgi:DNA-binding response OmpR family regulator
MDGKESSILVLEDDENDALLLKRALRRLNVSSPVHIVTDGEEGIAYLSGTGKYRDRATYPFPGFIITDLKMPKKSGMEVLKWLSEHRELKVVPTLVLTSSKEESDVAKAYGFGANSYMVKPADFQDLERMMRLIHDYWNVCEKPFPPQRDEPDSDKAPTP